MVVCSWFMLVVFAVMCCGWLLVGVVCVVGCCVVGGLLWFGLIVIGFGVYCCGFDWKRRVVMFVVYVLWFVVLC